MPLLPNPRHERVAQALATGKTADKAYVAAGYKENRHNAAKLTRQQHILTRVSELQSKAAEQTVVTIQSLTEELEEARAMAVAEKQSSAAVAATMGKAKLHGLLIEKKQISGGGGGPVKIDISGMSREQISSAIENLAHLASLADDTDQDDEGGAREA